MKQISIRKIKIVHYTNHIAHPTPSRTHPHELRTIFATAELSKYIGSIATTALVALLLAVHILSRCLGAAPRWIRAPHPFVVLVRRRCGVAEEEAVGG